MLVPEHMRVNDENHSAKPMKNNLTLSAPSLLALALALSLLWLASSANLFASEPSAAETASPINRLDFTTVFFDTVNSDRLTGLFSYTRNFSMRSNLNLRVAYLDSNFGLSGGTGFGDTTVTWSYLPNAELSIGPWVPRIVGSGIAVTLPTGNENQARGLGSTIVTPFVGTVFPITDTFSIAPTLAYAYSVDQVITGEDLRVAVFDIGFIMVRKSGWWFSLYTGYVKDFEADNTTIGGRISVGKSFKNGWGLSTHYIDLEGFAPGIKPIGQNRFNQVYELTVHYSF
jgi:hypothetical protein